MDVFLFTDGGGDKNTAAGAGAIVRVKNKEMRLLGFLGKATNNEAEIMASLLGFSYIYALKNKLKKDINVTWVADSKYLLQSATSYILNWQKNNWKTSQKKDVKNIGLWKTYLALSKDLTIDPIHVFAHKGHLENEACDSASTWGRHFGKENVGNNCLVIDIDKTSLGKNWHFINCINFLKSARTLEPGYKFLLLEELKTHFKKYKSKKLH